MLFSRSILIDGREISASSRTYFIAEAGVNHCGNMDLARKLIDVAVEAGADAVKFQAFSADHIILKSVPKAAYQRQTTDSKESQHGMLKKLEISAEQIGSLIDYTKKKKITFLITPFDDFSLEMLDQFSIPAFKVASTDITNPPFLKKVAQRKKPIILSTGMAYLEEVREALKAVEPLNKDVVLLQCTGNYPIPEQDANLNVIRTYLNEFTALVGYSDHSVGLGASPYAVAMGAKVIEKHFTLDKTMAGPDHSASLDPKEIKELVREIRRVELFLGNKKKEPAPCELANRKSLQKCFVARVPIRKGETFSDKNLVAKRTNGKGISPIYYRDVFGTAATRDYAVDDILESNLGKILQDAA